MSTRNAAPELTLENLLKAYINNMPNEERQRMGLMKDVMPEEGRPTTGYIFDGGPFSPIDDEIWSLSIGQSSPLTNWIPTERVTYKHDLVQHMSWDAVPFGFDGHQTYKDFLSSIVISDCGYGPSGVNWDGFTYEVGGGSFSWTTPMMMIERDSGMQYWEDFPRTYKLHKGGQTMMIDNDQDWALSQLLDICKRHVDYIILYGEKANSDMEWDGLSTIITTGYIGSRVKSGSTASAAMANPLVMNGATLGSPADPGVVLRALETMVADRIDYIETRGWSVNITSDASTSDVVLLMHPYHLLRLQEALAAGGLTYFQALYNFTGEISISEFDARLTSMRNAKTLPLGGRDIPVLLERNLGGASTINIVGGGTNLPAHTADIFFLVRRVDGNIILSQKFIDWSQLDYPFKADDDMMEIQGGIARSGYVEESKKCWYFFMHMQGRMVVKLMPVQARLTSVTIQKRDVIDMRDQSAFWAEDFAAYNGAKGGENVVLLVGQRVD